MTRLQPGDATGDPAVLGLMAFGMSTVLLNIHNAGGYPLDAMVLAMGFFFGGAAQVIAGWQAWCKGNVFAQTAFSAYGFFWMLLAFIILLPRLSFVEGAADLAAGTTSLGWFFLVWGAFSAVMTVAARTKDRALYIVFVGVTTLFVLLAASEWAGSEVVQIVAGWVGIATGIGAMYVATAHLWNALFGRDVLPLGSSARATGDPLSEVAVPSE